MNFTQLLHDKKRIISFLYIFNILPLVTTSLFLQNHKTCLDIGIYDISKNNYTNSFKSFQNNNTTNLL